MNADELTRRRAAAYRDCLRTSPSLYRAAQKTAAPDGEPVETVCRWVLGPALGGFVRWLLEDAAARGIKRLYFLARDGYFFYQAARIYCEMQRLPLALRYLSCSRYSLRIPLFHRDTEGALDAVCRRGLHVTPLTVLARAGLTEEEQQAVLERLRLPFAPEETIPPAMLPDVRRALGGCRFFLDAMNRRSAEALPGLAGYLRQEGLLEDTPDAVVDSGWVGSMQKTLGEALALLGRTRKLEGYYWGLFELPPGMDPADYHPFYFSPEQGLREKVFFNNCLFEAVFTAPHGMTMGYRRDGTAYTPLYGPADAETAAFVRRIEPVLLAYIRHLAGEPGKVDTQKDRTAIYRLFRLFMANPTRPEAEAFGSLPFSDDVLAGGEGRLAAPLTEWELKAGHALPKLLAMAGRGGAARESAWYEGSAVLHGRKAARHQRQYRLYQRLRFLRKSRQFRKERREKPHG